MARYVLINDISYDVDTERVSAHQALLDAGEREVRVRIGDPDDPGSYASEYVLTDSGRLHMRCGR